MDFSKLGEKHRSMRAPGDTGLRDRGGNRSDDIVARVRESDRNQATALKKASVLYGIAAGLFLLVIVGATVIETLLGNDSPFSQRKFVGLSALAFIYVALTIAFLRQRRSLRGIDYGQPISAFLDHAERRYRLVRAVDLAWAIPLFAILVIGGWYFWTSAAERYLPDASVGSLVIAYACFLLLVVAAGCFFTYRDWQRERGKLWKELEGMRREMHEDPEA